jgi:hypothetical protein
MLHETVREFLLGHGLQTTWNVIGGGIPGGGFVRGRIIGAGVCTVVELLRPSYGLVQCDVIMAVKAGVYPDGILGGVLRPCSRAYTDSFSWYDCSLSKLSQLLVYFHRRRLV